MDKIDRLVWAAGLSVVSHGARMGIRTNQPALLAVLMARLPWGARLSSRPTVDRLFSVLVAPSDPTGRLRRFHLLYVDAERLARTFELEELLDAFERELELSFASLAPRRIFVHAGVVGWKGRAIVMPGASYSGKSTLVAALVKAGATYYSDEYAVLDARGRVHPYARALQLRDEAGLRPASSQRELGRAAGRSPLPVGMVAAARFQRGARWRSTPLSPGRACLTLMEHTVPVRSRPEATLASLRRAVQGAIILRGTRGEANETAERLLGALDRDDRAVASA